MASKIKHWEKGKKGEREFVNKIVKEEWGLDGRRGQQFSGVEGKDVVTSIKNVHFEIKRTETLRLHEAVAQSISDAGSAVPVVCHRRNRGEWLITLQAKDMVEFAERLLDARADTGQIAERSAQSNRTKQAVGSFSDSELR